MPSPFPGIDPFLEGRFWPGFHDRFIVYAADRLQAQLPLRYRALITERLVLCAGERWIEPDVSIAHRSWVRETAAATYGSTPAATKMDEPAVYPALLEELSESFIEIQDRQGDRVVTALELLSPSNKTPGPGHDGYLRKQEEVLRARANLVEIDLLRSGVRTVAPDLSFDEPEPYYSVVAVWRAVSQQHELYFVQLERSLPHIRIPLLPEDDDVGLDVQAVFASCYDAARYELDLDYSCDPSVELSTAETAWLDEWLRAQGVRS